MKKKILTPSPPSTTERNLMSSDKLKYHTLFWLQYTICAIRTKVRGMLRQPSIIFYISGCSFAVACGGPSDCLPSFAAHTRPCGPSSFPLHDDDATDDDADMVIMPA